jgi:hypothetical protein
MTRPLARATAMAFLALGSLSVYASDSEVSDVPAAAYELPLPKFVASDADFYPASAARKMMQGSVGLEFQIDDQGRAQVMGQTFADSPDFAPSAQEFLKQGRFRVPDDWVQSGGPDVRFVVEVQFSIARGEDSCAKKPPHVADMEIVMVCRVQAKRRTRL